MLRPDCEHLLAPSAVSRASRSISRDIHPFYDEASPEYVHPKRWCINRADLAFFGKEVKERWNRGDIPRDEKRIKSIAKKQIKEGMSVRMLKTVSSSTGEVGELEKDLTGTVVTTGTDDEDDVEVDFPDAEATEWVSKNNLAEDDGHDDETIGPSVYQVTTHYIKPLTSKLGGVSWALWRHPKGLECDCFASHAWFEGTFEFILMLKRVWPWQSKNIYICFLGNPQPLPDGFLNQDPYSSPFFQCLSQASFMVVIPNAKVSIYDRTWCVFEASEGIKLTKQTHLRMILPWVADPREVLWQVVPALPMTLLGWAIAFYILVPHIAVLFGPAMWLLSAYVLCYVTNYLLRHNVARWTAANPDYAKRGSSLIIKSAYLEMSLIGFAFGLSCGYFLEEDGIQRISHSGLSQYVGSERQSIFELKHLNINWERGEGTSCPCILLSLWLAMLYNMVLVLTRDVVKSMGGRLSDFTSVRDAKCSKEEDRKQIIASMEKDDRVDKVDRDVRRLIEIGRFNRGIKRGLMLGLGVESCKDGINPFKVACAVYSWEFWWITDVAGKGHRQLAIIFPLVTIALLLILVYAIGDDTIYAIDAFLWSGVFFSLSSNHSMFFNKEMVASLQMSRSSMWLQIGWLVIMVLFDLFHYCGVRRALKWYLQENGYDSWSSILTTVRHPDSKASQDLDDSDDSEAEEIL